MARLVLEGVTFRYGLRRRPLLKGLTLTFDRGLTLLLGPNGAGKSTVLGLASSALTPQQGRVLVDDIDSRRRRAYRAKVSWLPQRPSVVPGSTAREQVALAGWLKGMSRPAAWDAAIVALDRVDLRAEANQRAGSLSGGQLARAGLAQALVHDSAVVLLDEPTASLDPLQRKLFHALAVEAAQQRCLLVATHDIADLDEGLDTIVLMKAGTVRFCGSVNDFLAPVRGTPDGSAVSAYAHWMNAA